MKKVSVSFRSSILFYFEKNTIILSNGERFPSPFGVQFSFIVIVLENNEKIKTLFPSPFGVQFSFILPKLNPYFIVYYFIIFVRILEIFKFLFLNNKKYTLTPIFKASWRLLKKNNNLRFQFHLIRHKLLFLHSD